MMKILCVWRDADDDDADADVDDDDDDDDDALDSLSSGATLSAGLTYASSKFSSSPFIASC